MTGAVGRLAEPAATPPPVTRRAGLALELVWVGGWVAFWILSGFHYVPAALAVQAALSFGCCVAYALNAQVKWAAGAIVSLLPLLAGITPYGHASPAARTLAVSGLLLLTMAVMLRDGGIRQSLRAAKPAKGPSWVVWIDRSTLLICASMAGVVFTLLRPAQSLPISEPHAAANVAALVVAVIVEELVFRGLQFGAMRDYPAVWIAFAQALTFGGCYAAGGNYRVGLIAGAVGAGLALYRLRDRQLWPAIMAHLIVVVLVAIA